MRIGAIFPQTEFGNDPFAIKDYAQTAEGLGFTHILAYEHVLGVNPDRPGGWTGVYTYEHPFLEPFVLFSFMAAVTHKIEFTTGILVLPQRQTALVAKQAATLDVISNGRLRLGVGIGWNAVEYTSLNQNFHDRGRRIEEQVQVLRLLWTQPLVNFSGRWHNIQDAGINPLPHQRPIPIWFGGHADAVLQRVARMGDGWLPSYRTPQEADASIRKLNDYLEACQRTMNQIGIEPRIYYGDGNPANWHAAIQGWQSLGATHLTLNTMGSGFQNPADHIAALNKFAQEIDLK